MHQNESMLPGGSLFFARRTLYIIFKHILVTIVLLLRRCVVILEGIKPR